MAATELKRIETGLLCASMAIETLTELEKELPLEELQLKAKGLESVQALLTTEKLGYRFFKVLDILYKEQKKAQCKGTPIERARSEGKKLRTTQTREYWLGRLKGIEKAIAILVEV